MEKAHEIEDPSQEAAADAYLHQLVYESAHNVVLLHVMRVFSELLRNDVLYNRHQLYRRFGVRDQLLKQHLAIAKEILRGDPKAAESGFRSHQLYVSDDRGHPPRRIGASTSEGSKPNLKEGPIVA